MNQTPNQPLIVTCQCGQQFRARADLAGKRVKCLTCGAPIDVPAVPIASKPASAPEDDFWEDLGALENASTPLASSGQMLTTATYHAPRAKRSLPSWLMPVALAIGGIMVLGVVGVFVASFISGFPAAVQKHGDDQIVNWETFHHPSGGFSIAMPTGVNTQDKPTPGAFCSRTIDAYSRSTDGTLVSVTMCVDVVPAPTGVPRHQEWGERMWGSYPDVTSKPIQMFGEPGLEYRGTIREDGETQWICSRVFLLDDRLYELTVTRKFAEPMASDQLDAFFASFQPTEVRR